MPDSSRVGDFAVVHEGGAHCIAMAFRYNGRLGVQELIKWPNGFIERIRRFETVNDYFATLSVGNSPTLTVPAAS